MTTHRRCVCGFWMQACVLLLGGMGEGDRESAMFGMQLRPHRLLLQRSASLCHSYITLKYQNYSYNIFNLLGTCAFLLQTFEG